MDVARLLPEIKLIPAPGMEDNLCPLRIRHIYWSGSVRNNLREEGV